jgi:hypothetical protein
MRGYRTSERTISVHRAGTAVTRFLHDALLKALAYTQTTHILGLKHCYGAGGSWLRDSTCHHFYKNRRPLSLQKEVRDSKWLKIIFVEHDATSSTPVVAIDPKGLI